MVSRVRTTKPLAGIITSSSVTHVRESQIIHAFRFIDRVPTFTHSIHSGSPPDGVG